jgi:hypothetical protein
MVFFLLRRRPHHLLPHLKRIHQHPALMWLMRLKRRVPGGNFQRKKIVV